MRVFVQRFRQIIGWESSEPAIPSVFDLTSVPFASVLNSRATDLTDYPEQMQRRVFAKSRSVLNNWGLDLPPGGVPDVEFDQAKFRERWYLTDDISWRRVGCPKHPAWDWGCFLSIGGCMLDDPVRFRPVRDTLDGHLWWEHDKTIVPQWMSTVIPTEEQMAHAKDPLKEKHVEIHGGASLVEEMWREVSGG